MRMIHYVYRLPDGTIHVQNAVGGFLGQHHAHTAESFAKWRKGVDVACIEEIGGTGDCCDLKPGEVQEGC